MPNSPLLLANNAIHQVNTKLPYISTTRTYRMINNIGTKHNISPYLCNYPMLCNPNSYSNKDKTPIQKKVLTIYKWFSKLLNDFANIRKSKLSPEENTLEYVEEVFDEVKNLKLANCGELAIITAMVLKAKGIDNAYTAVLTTNGTLVDHVVTVFNKDNSKFTGKIINNKTIIVDSWLGIADYARNYFSKHRGECSNFVRIPNGKMGLRNIQKYDLDNAEIKELMLKYPEILKK